MASGTPAMLTQVEKDQKAGQPIVFLGWSPHWMTVQFKATFLEDPDKVWGGAGTIRTISRKGWAADNPDIATFLKNLTFSTDEAGQFYYDHDKARSPWRRSRRRGSAPTRTRSRSSSRV